MDLDEANQKKQKETGEIATNEEIDTVDIPFDPESIHPDVRKDFHTLLSSPKSNFTIQEKYVDRLSDVYRQLGIPLQKTVALDLYVKLRNIITLVKN